MKKVQLLALFVMVISSACKKTQTINALDYSLTNRPWKVAKFDNNKATNPKGTVLYAATHDCVLDDTYFYDMKGVVTVYNGTDRCDLTEPDKFTFHYIFDKTSNTITVDGKTYKLAELSDTQLKYYTVLPAASGAQYEIHIFQH